MITSPIQLGYKMQVAVPSVAALTVTEEVVVTPPEALAKTREEIIQECWPKDFYEKDGHLKFNSQDKDGVVIPVDICATVFWATGWVRLEDKTWELGVGLRARNGKICEFTIPAVAMGSAEKLTSAFASYGIFLSSPKLGGFALNYMKDFYHNLQYLGAEVDTVGAFGWDANFESFVLGTRRITATTIENVHVTDEISSSGMAIDFGVSGDKQKWIDLVDQIYNRPGAEMYQFLFLVSASAPLVKLAGFDNYHGIPTALTGETGLGKTTTCQIANSIWGKGSNFTHTASDAGTTAQAMVKRVAIMRHMVRIFDEITGQDVATLSALLFALSNGQDKDRLTPSGHFSTGGKTWDMPSFVTGNLDITGTLDTLARQQKDAAQVRVFEIKLDENYNSRLWGGELGEVKRLINDEMQHTYGHVGLDLMRYYIKHKDKIKKYCSKVSAARDVDGREGPRERFYQYNLTLALVAGKIMQGLGIIKFDLALIENAVMDQIIKLRGTRIASRYTDEEYVGQFLSWLHGKVLITKHIASARNGDTYELPIESPRNEAPLARLALTDKRFIVSAKALNDWCKECGDVSSADLREWMDKHDYILHIKGRELSGAWNFRLGQGTHVTTGLTRCYELDYSKMYGRTNEGGALASVTPISGVVADQAAGAL